MWKRCLPWVTGVISSWMSDPCGHVKRGDHIRSKLQKKKTSAAMAAGLLGFNRCRSIVHVVESRALNDAGITAGDETKE